jgi:hypothetical protein
MYISELKRNSEKDSQRIFEELLKISRFPSKSDHSERLEQSLKMTGQLDIFKKTLLNKNVKSKHATALKNKLNKKWNKIKKLKLAKTVQTHQIAIELGRKIEMKIHILDFSP